MEDLRKRSLSLCKHGLDKLFYLQLLALILSFLFYLNLDLKLQEGFLSCLQILGIKATLYSCTLALCSFGFFLLMALLSYQDILYREVGHDLLIACALLSLVLAVCMQLHKLCSPELMQLNFSYTHLFSHVLMPPVLRAFISSFSLVCLELIYRALLGKPGLGFGDVKFLGCLSFQLGFYIFAILALASCLMLVFIAIKSICKSFYCAGDKALPKDFAFIPALSCSYIVLMLLI